MTNKRTVFVLIFLLFLTGIGICLYPTVSKWIFAYTAREEIALYDDVIEQLEPTELAVMEQEAQDYNKVHAKAGMEAGSVVSYDDLLAVTDAIGYVDIPKINIYLPIFHGTSEEVLQRGIGHMEETSLPIGGESTHAVLAGHTGMPKAELFTNIDKLVIGDVFYIHVLGEILAYQVDQIKIVDPEDSRDIQIVSGEDYVTLLTCTPYGINDHRLLVRGTRIPYSSADDSGEQEAGQKQWFLIGVLVVILLILFFSVGKRRKIKKTSGRKG